MSRENPNAWEKISTLTAFMGGLTALIFAITGIFAVPGESERQDLAIAATATTTLSVSRDIARSTNPFVPSTPMQQTVVGWVFIGKTADHEAISAGDSYTTKLARNLRGDHPRFPFYRFADTIAVVPEGTALTVVEVQDNIGTANHTWLLVNYQPVN